MVPAARRKDTYFCPVHGSGAIFATFNQRVIIEKEPAARVADFCLCADNSSESIRSGNQTVFIEGFAAAGVSSKTVHGGVVLTGASRTYIGDPAATAAADPKNIPPECAWLADAPRSAQAATADLIAQNLEKNKVPYTVKQLPDESHTFPKPIGDAASEQTADAHVYEVTVRGRPIKVYEPVTSTTPPGNYQPSADHVARALATMPKEEVDKVSEVNVSPIAPADKGRLAEFQGNGVVSIYPSNKGVRTDSQGIPGAQLQQQDLDWLMVHEGGHQVHSTLRERYGKENFDTMWKSAIESDKLGPDSQRSVTQYGENALKKDNIQEDFADAVVIYRLTRGTRCEGAARAMFPARYAMLDAVLTV